VRYGQHSVLSCKPSALCLGNESTSSGLFDQCKCYVSGTSIYTVDDTNITTVTQLSFITGMRGTNLTRFFERVSEEPFHVSGRTLSRITIFTGRRHFINRTGKDLRDICETLPLKGPLNRLRRRVFDKEGAELKTSEKGTVNREMRRVTDMINLDLMDTSAGASDLPERPAPATATAKRSCFSRTPCSTSSLQGTLPHKRYMQSWHARSCLGAHRFFRL